MERITSAKNPVIRLLRSLRDRKGREEAGQFLVEGEKLLGEALGCGLTLGDLIADEDHAGAAETFALRGARAHVVPRSLLESVCDTRTPQGHSALQRPQRPRGRGEGGGPPRAHPP